MIRCASGWSRSMGALMPEAPQKRVPIRGKAAALGMTAAMVSAAYHEVAKPLEDTWEGRHTVSVCS